MTVAYVDGPGLRHFRDTYCLTAAQVNTLINAAITAYKQDVYTVVSTLPAQGVEGIGYLVPCIYSSIYITCSRCRRYRLFSTYSRGEP